MNKCKCKMTSHMAKCTNTHSLLWIIECVGDSNSDLHPCLVGQLLDGCIPLFPKWFGVILV